jgi:hypothetical protein
MYIDRKDAPSWMLSAFPSYTGRKYSVVAGYTVQLSGDSWEGGSKTTYVGVNMETGQTAPPPKQYGNPFTNSTGKIPFVKLQPNFAIVSHQIFCGQDCGLVAYVHPDNLAKLLPHEASLTEDERVVLRCTKENKSSYGGISNYRFHVAKERHGMTLDVWADTKAALTQKGLLDKRGAITTQGRNAINPD